LHQCLSLHPRHSTLIPRQMIDTYCARGSYLNVLLSLPSRRSSDLPPPPLRGLSVWQGRRVVLGVSGGIACYKSCILARRLVESRSEEHTSELQSRENLVCRLLLEKKNSKKTLQR